MASNSKSITLYSNNSKAYYLQAYFNEERTSTSNNSSRIYVEAKLTSGGYRWTSSYASYLRIYWHDNRENYDRLVAETSLTSITAGGSAYASGYIDPLYHNSGAWRVPRRSFLPSPLRCITYFLRKIQEILSFLLT